MSYLFNNQVTLTNLDAFGRSRVSEPMTIADYTHVYGQNSDMLFSTSGNGTYSYRENEASVRLSVGTNSSDNVTHQSRMYHHYQPGKSQLIYSSFNFLGTSSNCDKRIGYFDDRNGIFLNLDGNGELSFIQRSYTDGTQSNMTYSQSNWNKDKCNGTGPSKFDIDITQTQLVFFDFQWLGVGRLRCGFVHDGNLIVAHEIYHSNNLDKVYWSNPTLPVRSQVINTGIGSGTASMDQICSTVISEGGYDSAGYDFSVGDGSFSVATASYQYPALAIRLKNTFNGYPNRATLIAGSVKCLAENNNLRYSIWRLPSSSNITGGTWTSVSDDSVAEYNNTITSWSSTGGTPLNYEYVAASNTTGWIPTVSPSIGSAKSPSAKKTFISQNIDSTDSNVFLIVVTPLAVGGGGCDFRVAINWREVY